MCLEVSRLETASPGRQRVHRAALSCCRLAYCCCTAGNSSESRCCGMCTSCWGHYLGAPRCKTMLGVHESKESTVLLFCIRFKQHLVVRHMLLCPTVSSWICSRPARPLSAYPTAAVAWSCRALASPVFRVVYFLGVSSRDVVPFSWDAHLAIRACHLATTSKTCLFVPREATFGSSFLFCFVYVVLCAGVGCMDVILLAGQKPFCELLWILVFLLKRQHLFQFVVWCIYWSAHASVYVVAVPCHLYPSHFNAIGRGPEALGTAKYG